MSEDREAMEYDVVIVGAGGAGMRAAIEAGPRVRTAVLTLALVSAFVLLLLWVIPSLVNQALDLFDVAPTLFANLRDFLIEPLFAQVKLQRSLFIKCFIGFDERFRSFSLVVSLIVARSAFDTLVDERVVTTPEHPMKMLRGRRFC